MTKESNMLPCLTQNDSADAGKMDFKFFSKKSLWESLRVKLSYIFYVNFFKFTIPMIFSFMRANKIIFVSMMHIIQTRYIFQVIGTIIKFISIDMVNLIILRPSSKKCISDELMNIFCFLNSIVQQTYMKITTVRNRPKNPSFLCVCNRYISSNVSMVGNRITFKIINGFPNLHEVII